MAITIFLAVAQNERDRTAERIKSVIDHKIKNREACFGYKAIPFGYTKAPDENGVMRLVKDPKTKQMVQEFWDILIKSNNLNKAIRHMGTYGISREWVTWSRMTKSDFYCGIHKGIQDFCEPYVSPEDWLKYNESKPLKANPVGRVYLFRGLPICEGCGRKLCGQAGKPSKSYNQEYKTYRCSHRSRGCTNPTTISEKRIEDELLKNLEKYVTDELAIIEIEDSKPKPKPKYNRLKQLKEQRRRLEIVYMAGNKTDEEYLKEDAGLKLEIDRVEKENEKNKVVDVTPLKDILESDFRTLYEKFNDEEKQQFWLNLVKKIYVEDNKIKRVSFFE